MTDIITTTESVASIVTAGFQGPPGPGGIGSGTILDCNPNAGTGGDDTTAFQAVAASGKAIFLPPPPSGAYNIASTILLVSNTKFPFPHAGSKNRDSMRSVYRLTRSSMALTSRLLVNTSP